MIPAYDRLESGNRSFEILDSLGLRNDYNELYGKTGGGKRSLEIPRFN